MLSNIGEDDEVRIPETDGEKIHRLRDKVIELESMIRAIEVPLLNAGYLDKLTSVSGPKIVINPGIRIAGELSFRGRQKASEYFKAIIENEEGNLSFHDYRAMASISEPYGIVHSQEMLHW